MKQIERDQRVVGMLRECRASAAPALLLALACLALVAIVAFSALAR